MRLFWVNSVTFLYYLTYFHLIIYEFSFQNPHIYNEKTGDRKVVEVLVRNSADVNLENKDKETPLHIATVIGEWEKIYQNNNNNINNRIENRKTQQIKNNMNK